MRARHTAVYLYIDRSKLPKYGKTVFKLNTDAYYVPLIDYIFRNLFQMLQSQHAFL